MLNERTITIMKTKNMKQNIGMVVLSYEMRQYLSSYLQECDRVDPVWMHRDKGLCMNTLYYCEWKGLDSLSQNALYSELCLLFDKCGLERDYPFSSCEEYIQRMKTGTQHLCYKRRQWIERMLHRR